MGKHKEKKPPRKSDQDIVEEAAPVEKKEKKEKKSKEERKSKKRARKDKERTDDEDLPAPDVKQATKEVDDDVNDRKRKKDKKKKKRELLVEPEESEPNKEKKKKKRKKNQEPASQDSFSSPDKEANSNNANATLEDAANKPTRIVASSALDFYDEQVKQTKLAQTTQTNISLLLFYQYVEPPWDESTYDKMLKELEKVGKRLQLTGRMRVAKEGLNCTLTSSHESIMEYCQTLQTLRPNDFKTTEFKVTQDLPQPQKFRELKVMAVVELVNYGLEGTKAPPMKQFHGTHLEPKDYHMKLAQDNTVIIDVRNHYEANIGRFVPPTSNSAVSTKSEFADSNRPTTINNNNNEPPKWLDPKMRKSTEFPAWLDRPETKEQMKGKQVLMYCTGKLLYCIT
jgi:predicted sulfurtransferase